MISYGRQSIDQSDIDAVVDVLNGDWLTQGPAVETFENDLKSYFGSAYACTVSNGTAALHLAGIALDWKEGDIVLTTPISFLATSNCIIYAGATPDFVDIDSETYTINPNLVEEKIIKYESLGKKVKAVIGVDYGGYPCDWKALREIADKYDLQLVNDNCHALGATYLNDKQYAVKYADVVTQSFHPVKHITTGEGGAILTNNSDLDEKVRRLRTHGMTKNKNILEKNDGPWYYEIHNLGYNYRMTDIQAALGSSQIKKLDQFLLKRRKIAEKYDQLFINVEKLKIPFKNASNKHAYHLYALQVDFGKLVTNKIELFNRMKNIGIALQVHYIPVHLQPYYQKNFGFKMGDFTESESFYKKEVSLPIYPSLIDDQILLVANNILDII